MQENAYYYYMLFLPREAGVTAGKLQLMAAEIQLVAGLARSKQDRTDRRRGV